jgi:hypothetical protein
MTKPTYGKYTGYCSSHGKYETDICPGCAAILREVEALKAGKPKVKRRKKPGYL